MTTQNDPQVIELVAGDVADRRLVTVPATPSFVDMTWVSTVVGELITDGDVSTMVELTATVDDAVERVVEVNFGGAGGWLPDDAKPGGDYRLRIRMEGGGRTLTAPTSRAEWIVVLVSS